METASTSRCQRLVQRSGCRSTEGEGLCFTWDLHKTELPWPAWQVQPYRCACSLQTGLIFANASINLYSEQFYINLISQIFHRFAKLLLRLPALRSIGLKCLEHLFFFKLIGDTPIDTFLMEMLEAPHQITWQEYHLTIFVHNTM